MNCNTDGFQGREEVGPQGLKSGDPSPMPQPLVAAKGTDFLSPFGSERPHRPKPRYGPVSFTLLALAASVFSYFSRHHLIPRPEEWARPGWGGSSLTRTQLIWCSDRRHKQTPAPYTMLPPCLAPRRHL